MAKREYEEGRRTALSSVQRFIEPQLCAKDREGGLKKQGQERLIERGEERKNRKNRATYKKPQGAKVDRWARKGRSRGGELGAGESWALVRKGYGVTGITGAR